MEKWLAPLAFVFSCVCGCSGGVPSGEDQHSARETESVATNQSELRLNDTGTSTCPGGRSPACVVCDQGCKYSCGGGYTCNTGGGFCWYTSGCTTLTFSVYGNAATFNNAVKLAP
jgi:hypothetical protein